MNLWDIWGINQTIARRCDSLIDSANYTASKVDQCVRLLEREYPRKASIRFAYFFTIKGNTIMATIVAQDCTTTQAFGLIGNTPTGDTFAEPTVAVTPPTAGTVALQPSAQGTGGAFTTAGLFTATAGYLGPVELSADVQGVDDHDCTFNVVAPPPGPETVAFDPTAFKAT